MKRNIWVFTIVYGIMYPLFLGVIDYILYVRVDSYDWFMFTLFTGMHVAWLPMLRIIYLNHKTV